MRLNYWDTMQRAKKGYTRSLEPICRQWNLTRNELDILLFLANNPGLDRATDIVTYRGMAKSHVSMSVADLESRGLLIRRDDPQDRRTVHLSLSDAAREIAQAGQEAQRDFFRRIYTGLHPDEMAIYLDIATRISENILNMEDL